MVEDLLAFLTAIAQSLSWGDVLCYVIVCGLLLASGLGLPMPEDIPLLAGGILCHHGHASLIPMIILTFLFVLGADLMIFFLGRRYGHHVPRLPLLRYYLTEKRMVKAEGYFQRHGGKTLIAARFLPAVRAAVWFTAGACKISFWKMLLCDGIAALLSVPTLVLLGFFGADQFEKARQWAGIGQFAIVLCIVVIIGAILVFRMMRRKRKSTAGRQDRGRLSSTV
mgnify:CR=1 FL=1